MINVGLVVSCWFLSLHPKFVMHSHKSLNHINFVTHYHRVKHISLISPDLSLLLTQFLSSSVGTVTGLRLHGPMFEFPQGQEIFPFFQNIQPGLGPTLPPIQWLLRLRRPVREVRHSLSCTVQAKMSSATNFLEQDFCTWKQVPIIKTTNRNNFKNGYQ